MVGPGKVAIIRESRRVGVSGLLFKKPVRVGCLSYIRGPVGGGYTVSEDYGQPQHCRVGV